MKNDPAQRKHCMVPNGTLVIIGGAERKKDDQEQEEQINATVQVKGNTSVLGEYIRLCKGREPHIELITTAGEEDIEGTYKEYAACFKGLGAGGIGHIHHNSREEVDADVDLKARIKSADGLFIAGGDQLRLTSIYGGTAFLTDLKEAYLYHRLTVGGTSAGAMALSTPMIFGGTGAQELVAAGVKITTGFEFLKDVCIDTHFVHRGRFVRMAQVIATNPANIGIGIEEDTAVIVKNGLQGTVCGNGVVIVIDGKHSSASNIVHYDEDKKITIRDLTVSILSAGETLQIPQRNPPHV